MTRQGDKKIQDEQAELRGVGKTIQRPQKAETPQHTLSPGSPVLLWPCHSVSQKNMVQVVHTGLKGLLSMHNPFSHHYDRMGSRRRENR